MPNTLELPPNGLGDVLSRAARRFGDQQALFFEGAWSSYRDLDQDSNRFADSLVRLGVTSGQRVVIHVQNSRDWIVAYYGVAKTGAVVVPIDAMLTPEEVVFIVRDCCASVLISGIIDPQIISHIRDATQLKTIVTSFEAPAMADCHRQADLMAGGQPDFKPATVDLDALSSISYTSGTTGNPKGAMLSHRTVLLSAALSAEAHGRSGSDIFVSALPCTHVYGNAIIHAAFAVGARLVLLRRFDSEAALSAISAHRATMFEGVPTMYFHMLAHSRLALHDLSSLTRCTVGGQAMPVEKIAEVERVFGCPLIELWGMTELGGPAATHTFGDAPRHGSIGRVFSGHDVRLHRREPDTADAEALVGELCVRGPLVMQGYLNRAEATAETIDADGWLHTGDLATIDDNGFIEIVGRSKDVIITSGYNIYPTELEGAIAQHPAVAMVAVGKKLDADKGEIAIAYVVLKPGQTALAGEIEQACRDRLAPYKAPRGVVFVAELPKTGSGKIIRHRLAEAMPLASPAEPTTSSAPNYFYIRTEVTDRVGIIVMHGPKGINALNEAFISEIVDALHRFDRDPAIRCMIIRAGTLKYFSVGADINEMAARRFSQAFDDDFFTVGWARVAQCRKPLIAAVSGLALGGGCELALMCDIIIASDTAEFGLPEVRLGIFPGAGGTQRLARQIGKSKAMEMILTGEINLSAREALTSGLAARVVSPADLIESTLTLARKIAGNSTISVRMAKEAVNRVYESSLAEGLLFERRLFYASLATDDKTEGTRAFLEKRRPYFEDK
jgi:long-chain acyl-CoA synthetase